MATDSLSELTLFVAVARQRSFARVAAQRGVSRSAVSHAIRATEERLGVRLFNRTTRSVSLTEVGAALLAELEPAIDAVAAAVETVNAFRDTPRGVVRINMPRGAARLLMPMVAPFTHAYPGVTLEITTDDAFVDIVRDGFDVGIRFGESLARDMIAMPFGPEQRFAVVATPCYFANRPEPREPAELFEHACICRRFPGAAPYAWEFEKVGREITVAVAGPLAFDDSALIVAAARAGAGLAHVFEEEVRSDLAAGTLVRVLEDWCAPFPGYYIYYPSRRQMPASLRAFLDFAKDLDNF